jgi:hypothetical protein
VHSWWTLNLGNCQACAKVEARNKLASSRAHGGSAGQRIASTFEVGRVLVGGREGSIDVIGQHGDRR